MTEVASAGPLYTVGSQSQSNCRENTILSTAVIRYKVLFRAIVGYILYKSCRYRMSLSYVVIVYNDKYTKKYKIYKYIYENSELFNVYCSSVIFRFF